MVTFYCIGIPYPSSGEISEKSSGIIETERWTKYRDDEIGIEFEYPSSWEFTRETGPYPNDGLSPVKGIEISLYREPFVSNSFFSLNAFAPFDVNEERGSFNCDYTQIKEKCALFTIQGRKARSGYIISTLASGDSATDKFFTVENPMHKFNLISLKIRITGLMTRTGFGEEGEKAQAAYITNVRKKLIDNDLTDEDRKTIEVFDRITATLGFTK